MTNSQSLQSVHKVLELLLTKAAVSSKPQKSKVTISYKDLLAAIGQHTEKDINLIVKISMDWEASDEEQTWNF